MGIRGLTTFIQSRSHLCMDYYELHDTNLVIDGNAIACQLYRWHCPSANDCFGGDYDKYGKVVQDFFQLLSDCNITPYVIFDGGYENKKVATVISRMRNKVTTAAALDSVSEGSYSVFPLFLRECFEEILGKLNVKRVRCDFEADTETANIAKALDCPVLSYDSDYFIFDVLYVPFRTFEMKSKLKKVGNSRECYRYIPCEVYRVEKFLNLYGGMDKSNLPVLAVLLGNDYVRRSVFSLFFQNLKIQKCQKNQNEQQRRIKSLIVWLQNETKETAISKVLSRYKKENRQKVLNKIENAIKGYYYTDYKYLKYLDIELNPKVPVEGVDFKKVVENIEENEDCDSEFESSSSSEESVVDIHENKDYPKVPLTFFEKFRKCVYPPCFMDLLKNHYYCIPQVENIALDHSHTVSMEILSAIHKILTNSQNGLVCVTRTQNTQIGKITVPSFEKNLPNTSEINSLSMAQREMVLLSILQIQDISLHNALSEFPRSWHLFILTIKYLVNRSKLPETLIYSLVMCKIILEYVDSKIGFYRNKKNFDKKFSNTQNHGVKENSSPDNISEALQKITKSDCAHVLSKLLHYFDMEEKMKTYRRSFDRNLVHTISEFQSCVLHIKYLNCLIDYPYVDILISQTLNCTFVYNFTTNLKKRTSCDNYLEVFLADSPSILKTAILIVNQIKTCCPVDNIRKTVGKKRKKKNKEKSVNDEEEEMCKDICDDDNLFDPCNRFSLLAI